MTQYDTSSLKEPHNTMTRMKSKYRFVKVENKWYVWKTSETIYHTINNYQ